MEAQTKTLITRRVVRFLLFLSLIAILLFIAFQLGGGAVVLSSLGWKLGLKIVLPIFLKIISVIGGIILFTFIKKFRKKKMAPPP